MIETDVLIAGCGPAGLTAAIALAREGVHVMAITKHSALAPTPRAHFTNQRSFEIFRDFGIEAEALAKSASYTEMPNITYLRSFTGVEFGRVRGLQLDDEDDRNASPCGLGDLPQDVLEPILFGEATKRGADVRFDSELISFEQNEKGVVASVRDRSTGTVVEVRARYLIGADGGNSKVAETLDLPFEGPGKLGGSLSIIFECDLSEHTMYRPSHIYYIVRGPKDDGGAGLGILLCFKPWTNWTLIKGYAAGQETPHLSKDEAVEAIRDYLGLPDLLAHVTYVGTWDINSTCASLYQRGRVFCMGDAVHRHPPSNGLGSNCAMQDAYNLAWKLTLVLRDQAGPQLLESYSQERVPVGQQFVARATKSLQSHRPLLQAIGDPDQNPSSQHSSASDGAERRRAIQSSMHERIYDVRARGVELNQLYRSTAVVDEGQQPPSTDRDLELHSRATTCPGAHLPHAWVQRTGHDVSTLDLAGRGRFTVITGIGGEGWIKAAESASERFGLEISTVMIGPGCEITDLYHEWAERREIEESGCILVRPDAYVAWRRHSAEPEQESVLTEALSRLLDKQLPNERRDAGRLAATQA